MVGDSEADVNAARGAGISELAAYVEGRVPELAAHIGDLATQKGIRKGSNAKGTARAAIAMGGFRQSAHFGSTGEDFAVVRAFHKKFPAIKSRMGPWPLTAALGPNRWFSLLQKFRRL